MNKYGALLILSLLVIGGCSKDADKAADKSTPQDHVWKEQTEAIDKARQVEQQVLDAAKQQRQNIEEQSQ